MEHNAAPQKQKTLGGRFPAWSVIQTIQVFQNFGGDDDAMKPVKSAQKQTVALVAGVHDTSH